MEIAGCAAVITGGATGIGAAIAEALIGKGAKVTILARRKEVVDAKAMQLGALGLCCDVTKIDQIETAFAQADAVHGPARILVNSAADGRSSPLLNPDGSRLPAQILEDVVTTNLLGVMYVAQEFAARLLNTDPLEEEERGVLINISSLAGLDGAVNAAYAAAKGGVNSLSLSLAREFAPWGIRVMTVAPGATYTDMLKENAPASLVEAMAKTYVFPRRMGSPKEIASLAVHICENRFLNGSVIRMDGAVRRNDLRPVH